ncbi:unnamed protein product [Triticum turgidum subsp. durum]|uniref:Uncharacterized protein n=1 Tax=Triticum turgidum subsp. durum TaxID=4567 RepID=A0A9R1AEI7_TRITD|nr:unnamed protein product [Triticum turgidum subsp. durum]
MVCAYRRPSTGGGFVDVVAAFEAKLPFLLDHFFPLAGRIVANPRSRLPEVHCDNQGAELVVGEVGLALGSLDFGDLDASLVRVGVPVQSTATDEHFQELVDWVEEHKGKGNGKAAVKFVETATVGLGSPAMGVTSFASFSVDTDFGFGHAAVAMPTWVDCGRLCSGFVKIMARPGGDGGGGGSWIFGMSVWPKLAAALDSDEQRIFKPLTTECLGLMAAGN